MTELLIQRSMPIELAPTGDGWTVQGMAVPYAVESVVSDDAGATTYVEEFVGGAFNRDVAKGGRWVNLMIGHRGDEGDRYLGRCVGLDEDDAGLYPAFRLDRSHPQAEAARSGELTGWSVSAHIYRSRKVDRRGRQVTLREVCGLSHVAATPRPQYAGAGVLVARDHVMVDAVATTPILDAIRARGYGRG